MSRRARLTIGAAKLAEIDALLARHPPRMMEIPMRNGIAGEAVLSITVVEGGATWSQMKWANDRHSEFDTLASWMAALAASVIERAPAWDAPVGPPPLSPGLAFMLAWLPGRRVAHTARTALVERLGASVGAELAHAVDFSRRALKIEDSMVADDDRRHQILVDELGAELPRPASGLGAWLNALAAAVRPTLTTPVLDAAWKAGESARLATIAVELAAHVAYLRCAAPDDAGLRALAADRARDLTQAAAALEAHLAATGLPEAMRHAGDAASRVRQVASLEPTTSEGYGELNQLGRDLRDLFEAFELQLDPLAPPDGEGSGC
jgi:hypothetical protein